MTITNGTVEFERVTRPAEFESKRAKSSLFFVVEAGQDAANLQTEAMLHAQTVVLAALGLPAAPSAGVTEASLQRESAGAAPQGTGRGRRPPATPVASTVPPASDPFNTPAAPVEAKMDPFGGAGTATVVAQPATPPSAATAEVGAGTSAPPTASRSDAELTDDGMRTLLTTKIGSVPPAEAEAFTVRVKEMIADIHQDPKKSIYMFTRAQRVMFLNRLAALS